MFPSQRQFPRPRGGAAVSSRPYRALLRCEPLEDRAVPSTVRPAFRDTAGGAGSVSSDTLRTAYGIDRVAFGSVTGDGAGQTIAVVDAYDQPNLAGDLAAFDRRFGLPDPPSLTRLNQTGGTTLPAADAPGGWGVETSLDVEWAHAVAPGAAIVVVEANSDRAADLFTAVDTARHHPGVSVVSMSWGGDETAADSANDFHFTTPAGHTGVTFVAASGDRGVYGADGAGSQTVLYPAASPNVVAVGGTELTTGPGGTYLAERAWGHGAASGRLGGSGGGISRYTPQPGYQQGVVTQRAALRAVPDVAIDADPAGVPVYDSYDHGGAAPWLRVGGTSLVAPLWAGVIALADQGRVLAGLGTLDGRHDTLPDLYALPAGDFHDVTTGDNGAAAGPGYDFATGRGTPVVDRLVADLAGAAPRPTGYTSTADAALVTPRAPQTRAAGDATAVRLIPLGFTYWSFIQPAIARVPTSAGPLANVSVVNFGTTVYTGPLNVSNTINRIRANNGPITADDGAVFTNSGRLLPPGGTYYEFNVAPSNGTDHRFTFASPGPMRLVLNTNGSLYFTGDHYAHFTPVYVSGQSRPTIGSFTINPSTVVSGGSVTLTASNVTESGGTIQGVSFYLSGTLVGTGTRNGTTWTLPVSTTGFAAGSYTYTAVATDTAGTSSDPATATLTVTRGTPRIGSFTVSPDNVPPGTPVTLTAGNVTESGGTIVDVSFYLSGNLLGSGTPSGNDWSLPLATDSLAPGTYTLAAIATDDIGVQSAPATATLTVTGSGVPVIGSFTVSPDTVQPGTPVTLTAGNVTDTAGTVIDVSFYLGDTWFGSGTPSGNDWSLALATDGFAPGTYTFTAVATDDAGYSSAPATATLTVTGTGYSGVLLGWDVAGLTNFGPQGFAATQTAAGISNSLGLTRGSGVATNQAAAANAWGGSNWAASFAAGINGNEFVTFGLTVAAGNVASLASLDLYYRRSSSGPASGYWQYELNGSAWNTIGDFPNQFSSTSSSGAAMNELDLSGVGGLQNLAGGTVVVFRLVPYGASASGGTWYVYDQAGNDLVLNGSIQPAGGGPAVVHRKNTDADLAGALLTADPRAPQGLNFPTVPAPAKLPDTVPAGPPFALVWAPVPFSDKATVHVTGVARMAAARAAAGDLFGTLAGNGDGVEWLA